MVTLKNSVNDISRFVRGLRRPSKAANTRLLRERGEDIQALRIREVSAADIPALTALHVKTWTDTYWPVRNPPTSQIREQQWRKQFQRTDESWFCFVAENQRGELVGLHKAHPTRTVISLTIQANCAKFICCVSTNVLVLGAGSSGTSPAGS